MSLIIQLLFVITSVAHTLLMNRGKLSLCAICDEALTVEHVHIALRPVCRTLRCCCLSASLSEISGGEETIFNRLFQFLIRNLIEAPRLPRLLFFLLLTINCKVSHSLLRVGHSLLSLYLFLFGCYC